MQLHYCQPRQSRRIEVKAIQAECCPLRKTYFAYVDCQIWLLILFGRDFISLAVSGFSLIVLKRHGQLHSLSRLRAAPLWQVNGADRTAAFLSSAPRPIRMGRELSSALVYCRQAQGRVALSAGQGCQGFADNRMTQTRA
jgi:hypothetical protein